MPPQLTVIYGRISDSRVTDPATGRREKSTAGTADQVRRCRELARRLGWKIGPKDTHIIIENDLSAFKRRKIRLPDGRTELRVVRPGFRRALAMLADGRADALITLDLDRSMRDPRDLEDLIDVVGQSSPRILVTSVTGSLSGLSSDAEVFIARVLVAHANQSSRDTARRVSARRQEQALEGRFGGGRRPFGWERDGMTARPAEGQVIRDAATMLVAGASLREIAATLRDEDAPCTDGGTWSADLVRQVLMRPRNAGIASWRGEETGPARWDAVLPEPEWRAVVAVLSDPSRRPAAPGPAPRWLLSLIATCGVCGATVKQGGGYGEHPRYRCRERNGHVSRAARPADALVSQVIIGRLAMPDAAGLITAPGQQVSISGLVTAAAAARERMSALTAMFGAGGLTLPAFRAGYGAAEAELRRAETEIEAAAPDDALVPIAGRADAADVWAQLDMGRRRAIVRTLVEVTFVPGSRGGRRPDGSYFRPESVKIEWKRGGAGSPLRAVP